MKLKTIAILIRRLNRWEEWGRYESVDAAEAEFENRISKRGVTAWTWIGPVPEAKKMLADPTYMPPEKCRKAPCCEQDQRPSISVG